jgi:hypothetical protein
MSLFTIIPNNDTNLSWEDIKYCNDIFVAKCLLARSALYQVKHWLKRGITLKSQISTFVAESRIQEYGIDPDTQSYEYITEYNIGNIVDLLSSWKDSLGCTDDYIVREAIKNPNSLFGAITCI